MDLTHWDTVDIDFTFEQVAALACDWDPYLDQIERPPAAISAKRAFLMDKLREGYDATVSWCISTFKRHQKEKTFDDDGYLLLPDLPFGDPWPFNLNPCITPDIDGLWDDAKCNKDFDLPQYLKSLPPIEKQSLDRLQVCGFLAALRWKGGYDFTYGLQSIVKRDSENCYEFLPSGKDAGSSLEDDLATLSDAIAGSSKNRDEVSLASRTANEKPLHGKTQQHYLKVIAGLLTAKGLNASVSAMDVLRVLEEEGRQPDIDHRTLVNTLRKLSPYR